MKKNYFLTFSETSTARLEAAILDYCDKEGCIEISRSAPAFGLDSEGFLNIAVTSRFRKAVEEKSKGKSSPDLEKAFK